jgi:hypothetical protein
MNKILVISQYLFGMISGWLFANHFTHGTALWIAFPPLVIAIVSGYYLVKLENKQRR